MKRFAFGLIVAALLAGCGPSVEEINAKVRDSMQTKLDGPDFAQYHLKVDRVTLIHDTGSKYEGLATVEMNSHQHDIPIHVVADGKGLMWRADAGAFAFVWQEAVAKALDGLDAAAQSLMHPSIPPNVNSSSGGE